MPESSVRNVVQSLNQHFIICVMFTGWTKNIFLTDDKEELGPKSIVVV